MEVSLVLVQANGKSREVALTRPRSVIGRQQGCQIQIPAASVSREHCEITIEDDQVIVRDLGSSNGTFLNRQRVDAVEAGPGDLLAVGPAVFVVRKGGVPVSIDVAKSYARGLVDGVPVATGKGGAGGEAPQPKPTPLADPDDSSVMDFDFRDDDLGSQPQL